MLKSKVLIIAEAGCNHNGSFKIAKKMVDLAVEARVDVVKFQAFKSEKLASRFAAKAEYQAKNTGEGGTQLEMLKKLEISEETHKQLFAYCKQKKIGYLCTPFDLESIDFLAMLGLKILKIPSGEITNLPYLRKIGALRKKIILSTGMASLKEIENALDVLRHAGTPKRNISLLHCNTEYPTPFKDANLLAMVTLRRKFGGSVGYSDHTPGIEASIAAVALGARIIEKHFTLNKNMQGPDHKASLSPEELFALVKGIRNIELALGVAVKRATPSESKNIVIARKSIVAARQIRTGETFSPENLTTKRPGSGISPMRWDQVIGKKAKRCFEEDELVEL